MKIVALVADNVKFVNVNKESKIMKCHISCEMDMAQYTTVLAKM